SFRSCSSERRSLPVTTMHILSRAKRFVPQPLRPALRQCLQFLRCTSGYDSRVEKEIANYTGIDNVHDRPDIQCYWVNKYIAPMWSPFGFTDSIQFFRGHMARMCRTSPHETIALLSVGAGNCASEINIAEWLRESGIRNYTFECIDFNTELLERAR